MPSRGLTIVLVGFVALMGLDGANAFLYDLHLPHLYPPNLYLRLGTGLLTGLTFAGFVVPAFNSTVWQTGLDVSPLTSARDVLFIPGLEALCFIAATSGASVLLYPVSLIAILGVPILMGLLGAVIMISLLGHSNRAVRLADLLPTILGGLALALVVLRTFSAVRLALFGSGPLGLPM